MDYLPIFMNLRGRPLLVVGGGAVAARKLQLLVSAGATATVVAPALCDTLRAQASQGRLQHRAREFAPDDIAGHWLVIAATDSRAVNEQVAAAAEAARVPCNVVDKQDLCSFIMPAIIDRSPVQIAVSTGGASPVLARLVRERLESLLDQSLGTLARFADRWRSTARNVLRDTRARREFVSWLLTGPAARAVEAQRESAADRLAKAELDRRTPAARRAPAAGHVSLVGAGPGDPGLLTLKGLRALQEADVVVHDRLASSEVVELARRDAERIDVGKIAGGAGAQQSDINELLVQLARAGRRVVRLKGGDPFVFGRGGEEIDYLMAHGIGFDVVPGVSAALAAGAYSGVPLTDRRHAQSVRFLTGNSDALLDAFDFSDVAHGRETLAVYMSVAHLPRLQHRLLLAGVAPDMPVAFVENASRPQQRVIVGTVGSLARTAREQAVVAPCICLIGNVAAAAESHHWFGAAALRRDELCRYAASGRMTPSVSNCVHLTPWLPSTVRDQITRA
jgi:uroporphyrin-III C-methyltransferase/precorrin-2 dehydrogenase/sirohydrochlorin ferrochelatase